MKLTVECRGEIHELQVNSGHKLLEHLQENEIPVNAACGGNGSCQKCRVQVKEGFSAVSSADKKAFSERELREGWRLSCQALPRANLRCLVPDVENFKAKPRVLSHLNEKLSLENPTLACDLGSTGVVVALGNGKGESLLEAHLLNRQVRYGADVMTRLKVAQEKGVAPLREQVLETLLLCLRSLEVEAPELYQLAKAKGIFCSGNSAIVSFLHGFEIETLAVYPFQPAQREPKEFYFDKADLNVSSLPLMAGFVGADTFAGIHYLETVYSETAPWVFVDIGTNTEIVVNNGKGELWFSSAPAGPAFEGGNIVCGMRAEPGAISAAFYKNNKWELQTIGNDKARGICGSGLVDVMHEAAASGLISKDGYVEGGKLQITEELYLVADDIREFQLAKAATRTACDLLIARSGVLPHAIYLAGNFAEHLRPESIFGTGLLPSGIPLKLLGNASLKGTLLYATLSPLERAERWRSVEARGCPVELALQDDFQDAFVKNLNF